MVLNDARSLLEQLTPLKRDCGTLCGGACCRSLEGEATGMLLFPGEEDDYVGLDGWQLTETKQGWLVACPGTCDRSIRPLACRIFPLLPVLREDGIHVAVDARARAVCPLSRQGMKAMDQDFAEAVRQVGTLLAKDEEQRAMLQQLTDIQDELVALRKRIRGK